MWLVPSIFRRRNIEPQTILSASLILFTAYLIRGISGFGSGLIAIPLLAHFLPLQFVVPWILLVDFTASVVLSGRTQDRQAIHWKEIGWLMPTTALGLILGVLLLVNLPKQPLLTGLGLFVIAFGLRSLLFLHGNSPISRWWVIPTGLTGGSVGAMFGTGGPPYVIYLTHRVHNNRELRATLSGLFMIDGGLRIVVFAVTGLLNQDLMLSAMLGGLPIMIFGLYVGHRVHLGLSQAQMNRIIGILLLASGVSLLVRAFSG